MNRITGFALAVLLSTGFAAQAGAVVIVDGPFAGTDVGNIDDLIASTGVLSGEQAEVDFVNSMLGTSFTTDDLTKTEDVDWHDTDVDNVIAFALASGPGHYLVKNAQATVLFENLFDFDWGVINVSDLDLNLGDDMQISHVSEFGGEPPPPTPVPEAGTLALLGAGLLGLGLARRRRKSLL